VIPGTGRIFIKNVLANGGLGVEREITREAEYKRARYIGRIFQNPLLGTAGRMTLEDNMMICYKKGYKGLRISLNKSMREYFREQLRTLGMGMENRLNDNVDLFSGGQRQALTLLMTVMSKPSLLLLDEHTAALDPRNAEMIMELTLRFAKENNLTVMMITHNMSQALEAGNRLLMMDSGEIILDIDAVEKAKLTTKDIIQRFKDIKKKELANDEMLLG
jgi:putative ABC transport system ATP-binding protein